MARQTSGIATTSWWLQGGDDECPHCGAVYVYELEFRCTECDGPGCLHCKVVRETGHMICVVCAEAPPEQQDRSHD